MHVSVYIRPRAVAVGSAHGLGAEIVGRALEGSCSARASSNNNKEEAREVAGELVGG